ncbi:hypothetical protein A2U01_0066228, partial [Trifolium medium]|nr:hypothetical protein [Trifolium medium]
VENSSLTRSLQFFSSQPPCLPPTALLSGSGHFARSR